MCSLLETWINSSKWQSQLPFMVVVRGYCFQACIIPVACQCSWHRNRLLTSAHGWAWSQLPSWPHPLPLSLSSVGFAIPQASWPVWGQVLTFVSLSDHFFPLLPGQRLLHIHVLPPRPPPWRGFFNSADGMQPMRHPHLSIPLFSHDHSWKLDHPVYLLFVSFANKNIW